MKTGASAYAIPSEGEAGRLDALLEALLDLGR